MNLKALREQSGMTQEQVAANLSISRPTYTKYESGQHEPPFDILIKIAKLFKVSTDYILGYGGVAAYSFFNNLKQERIRTGTDVRHIAACIDVTPEEYEAYENGTLEPSMQTLCKIALYFCTSTDFLTGLDRSELILPNGTKVNNFYLTDDEASWLILYRSLSPEQKPLVTRMVEAATTSIDKLSSEEEPIVSAG